MPSNNVGGKRCLAASLAEEECAEDMVLYFETFAGLLEEQLLSSIPLPEVEEWPMTAA